MLLAWFGDDPDGTTCLHGSQVRNDFPQVVVVALFQLVLDHIGVTVTAFSNDVDAEGTGGLFAFSRDQLKVE